MIRFDLETGKVRVLDDQLAFANGVQLSADRQSVLVCETTLARVIRHWIGGNSSQIGKSEIFVDNLPGIPDNIRLTSSGNYWIAFAAVRHQQKLSIFDRLRNWPRLRTVLSVSDRINKQKCFIQCSSHFQFLPGLMLKIHRKIPAHGLVIELDKDDGHIVRSLHDAEGSIVPSVSQVTEYDQHLYFGSYYLNHIAVFKL